MTPPDPYPDPPDPRRPADAPAATDPSATQPAPVLPYATATTDQDLKARPVYHKPLPPEVPAILCGIGLLVMFGCLLERLIALPLLACVGWYVVVRFRREKHVRTPWLRGMQIATLWSAGWTVNAMRIFQAWGGWPELLWEFDARLRWSVYFVAAGVLAFAVCETAGRIQGWRRRAVPAALPVPPEAS